MRADPVDPKIAGFAGPAGCAGWADAGLDTGEGFWSGFAAGVPAGFFSGFDADVPGTAVAPPEDFFGGGLFAAIFPV